MARIRTVKPEFWDSPGVESLEPYWRLLYIAMWNWADDSGRGKAEARELMGFAFPRDESMTVGEFRRGLGEVRRVFGVVFYMVEGRSYYAIPSWDRHQKIDKRSASRWPGPDMGYVIDPTTNEQVSAPAEVNSENPPEDPPNVRSDAGAGTGEQGNRGTGELVKASSSPQAASEPDRFAEFWMIYPRKDDKLKAEQSWKSARKKAPQELIIEGARRYAADPNREDAFTKLPTTWLNRGSWANGPVPSRTTTQARPNAASQRNNENVARLRRMQEQEPNPFHQLALGAGQ